MLGKRIVYAAAFSIVVLSAPAPLLADFYDNFNDGWYERDPNDPAYDANDPRWTDPNNAVLWDIDNPDWTIMPVIGDLFLAGITPVGWLRLYADTTVIPYAFCGATVEDENPDPNTSVTLYDDSAPHYVVARMSNYDPCAGEILLIMHGDYVHWTGFMGSIELEWVVGGAPWEVRQLTIANLNGTDWDGASNQNRTDLDNDAGFWMALQWDGDGDPNNSYLRLAAWNGSKFDWDGAWDVQEHVVSTWDPNDPTYQYWDEGVAGFAPLGAPGDLSPGHADAKFDEIEIRWGTFTNVSRTLDLAIKTADKGTVTIDPDLLDDPNHASLDPNVMTDPNEKRRYTDGTEIVLVAEPAEGKAFRAWKIWEDPNHYPDDNYKVEDSNSVLYLTMDQDYAVDAVFKCGSSEMLPPVGMILLALALGLVIRRPT